MNEVRCEFCSTVLEEDDIFVFDEVAMCEFCYDTETCVCEDCNDRIWVEDAECGNSLTLCQSCYEDYNHCDTCERLIHRDDTYYDDDDSDTPYCSTCYHYAEETKVIQSYSYKPEPIFYGPGSLFLGVELEIDKGGESHDNAQELLDIANYDSDHLYAKHDGSIDDGFEMVSHPMDLAYHMTNMPWRDIFDKAIEMGYRSHQTSTCGLHVHVSRNAFGNTSEEQEEVIGRIVYFVESHWNEMLKFSRRTESSIKQWANRYGLKNSTKETYEGAKDTRGGRYVCINLANYNTIEFRIFRGTLRYESFFAALQLVDKICNAAISMSDKQFEDMTWNEFVAKIEKLELIEYLKSKQLYVNDFVAETEEL